MMRIGSLNELLKNVTYSVGYENSLDTPIFAQNGNLLCGESIKINWDEMRDSGIELTIDLGESAFVDRVILKTDAKTALVSVKLYDKDRAPLFTYAAETGKTITSHTLELEAGACTDKLYAVIVGDFTNMELTSLEICGAVGDELCVFPTPISSDDLGEDIPAAFFTSYSGDSTEALMGGKVLAEKYAEICGVVMTEKKNATVRFVTDNSLTADGYELEISGKGAVIKASNDRGFVCGAECFIKLTSVNCVRACKISDAPRAPFRGVHMTIPAADQMEFAKRLVKYCLSPMGYNVIIMEVRAGMKFDKHPEISDAYEDIVEKTKAGTVPPFGHIEVAGGHPVEKSEVKALVEYIRSFGIDVVPEIQCLGHVQTLTLVYPEIAELYPKGIDENGNEVDLKEEDARPIPVYPHCFCPQNDFAYELVFDILEEVIEVFEPREYIHMGHDEIYHIGICEKCRAKTPAELLAYDLNKIYDHLKSKGYKMMIWGDMLQPITKYKTYDAINMIPKDILLLDFIWYFHLDKDTEDNLLPHGFKVAIGNLYSSHYPRYEKRIQKDGIIGGQLSFWTEVSEKCLQQEGKLYDLFMTAQMLWSADYSHTYKLAYDRVIGAFLPEFRDNMRGVRSPSRNSSAKVTTLIENPITFPPRADIEQRAEFDVNEKYDSLLLYHTALRRRTRVAWKPHEVVGKYIITYTDGTTEDIELTASGNVGYWQRRHNEPVLNKIYRHNGYHSIYYTDGVEFKNENGDNVTIYRLEHILQKDKTVASVKLEQEENGINIFLCKAEGVVCLP